MTPASDQTTRPDNVDDIVATAIEQARNAERNSQVDAVRGATLVAEELTTTAEFDVVPPVELPGDRRRLLHRVEVVSTRTLGTKPRGDVMAGEAPYVRVNGLMEFLKADGTPRAKREKQWTFLPDELAPYLLGLAQVS